MMRRSAAAAALLAVVLVVAHAGPASAVGFGFGPLVYTVDVAETFGQLPIAAGDAFDALDMAFADLGVSEPDRAAIREDLDEGLQNVVDSLNGFPTILPIPHLGGFVEIPLPLVVVDGLRLGGGYLSEGLVKDVAGLFGVVIPSPLLDVAFDEDGFSGSIEADLRFRSFALSTELAKSLGFFLGAIDLTAGVSWVGGDIVPDVSIDVPEEMEGGVADALDALHLDGFTWSAFAVHAGVGIEVGPPFLRIGLRARIVLPLSASSGWWEIGVGDFSGSIEVVIRF